MAISIISLLAPYFERYITLERIHPTDTYNYKARGVSGAPVIETILHSGKCRPGSWLYVAVPATANLVSLGPREKLYVGSQTVDRMFRGDGMAARNFHHAEMRRGNGQDNLENFLRSGEKALIYHISAALIGKAVEEVQYLSVFAPLLHQPANHVGYWFEQFILYSEGKEWRWNTASTKKVAQTLFRAL
jgi:hypothetical protein